MALEGAMTALVTPMRDGNLDFDALDALIEQQIAGGIHGLVAVGTTGESATLTVEEHVRVVEFVVERTKKRVPVIAGAGANSTAEAIEMSNLTADVGADALLHVVPYYNKPNQAGMYAHFAAIAAATDLPIILYNVPGRTACDLLPETVARLAEIDNIVGIKEATGDMHRAAQLLASCGDELLVLSGDDFTTFPLYALGGRGVISVVSNVMPRQMAEMWNAASEGDLERARELHYQILPLTQLLFVEPNPIPIKEALAILGLIEPDLRLPMVRCSEALHARLRALLIAEGML
jgi:4-hydroxy-tetrahydrodipicolinate synthase